MYTLEPARARHLARSLRRIAYCWTTLAWVASVGTLVTLASVWGHTQRDHPVAASVTATVVAFPIVAVVVASVTLPWFVVPYVLEHIADSAVVRRANETYASAPLGGDGRTALWPTPAPGLPRSQRRPTATVEPGRDITAPDDSEQPYG